MHQPSPLYRVLKNNSNLLGKLYRHTLLLSHLADRLRIFLEPPLDQHCTVANYDHATLVLQADSAAWAARLRYNTPAILSYMRHECDLQDLKTLRIKIKPSGGNTTKPARRLTLSKASASLIIHTASLMPDDELRKSLLRLARHTHNPV